MWHKLSWSYSGKQRINDQISPSIVKKWLFSKCNIEDVKPKLSLSFEKYVNLVYNQAFYFELLLLHKKTIIFIRKILAFVPLSFMNTNLSVLTFTTEKCHWFTGAYFQKRPRESRKKSFIWTVLVPGYAPNY